MLKTEVNLHTLFRNLHTCSLSKIWSHITFNFSYCLFNSFALFSATSTLLIVSIWPSLIAFVIAICNTSTSIFCLIISSASVFMSPRNDVFCLVVVCAFKMLLELSWNWIFLNDVSRSSFPIFFRLCTSAYNVYIFYNQVSNMFYVILEFLRGLTYY